MITIEENSKSSIKTSFLGVVWRSGLHVWLVIWRLWVWAPSKSPIVLLSRKLYLIS